MIKYWNHNPVSGLRRALPLLLLAILIACDNDPDTIGSELLPDDDRATIISTDAFTVSGYTVSPKSLYSRDVDTFLIGGLENDVFGQVTASAIFKFQPIYDYYPQHDLIKAFGRPYIALYPYGNYGENINGVYPQVQAYELNRELDTLEFSYSDADWESLDKTLLNSEFSYDSNSLIKINLPESYAARYLEPYVNKDTMIFTYEADTDSTEENITDTPYYWGVDFDFGTYRKTVDPILITTASPYFEQITKIVGLNSGLVIPVIFEDESTSYIKYYLSDAGMHNFNANYFSFNTDESSEFVQSLNDTVNLHDKLYLQSNRAQVRLRIDGLDEIKAGLSGEAVVYKASLEIPVSQIDLNETDVIPARISLKFSDGSILPDDPQEPGSDYVHTNFLNRFDGLYYPGANAYRFDLSLYAADYLNDVEEVKDKNEFTLFIPDNMIVEDTALDTIIDTRNKAEMVVLNNGNNSDKPISFNLFYTTVDK